MCCGKWDGDTMVAITCFVARETLGGENPWYCPQCKAECLAKRTLTVHALPKVLMVQLKRCVCVRACVQVCACVCVCVRVRACVCVTHTCT